MFKRSSVLKPLDMILVLLEQNPKEADRGLVRAGAKEELFAHLDRIAPTGRKPGRQKREQVSRFVDLFFDGVLGEAHAGDVNQLLQRARLLRSAYLTYYRVALPQREIAREDKEPMGGFVDDESGDNDADKTAEEE